MSYPREPGELEPEILTESIAESDELDIVEEINRAQEEVTRRSLELHSQAVADRMHRDPKKVAEQMAKVAQLQQEISKR